MENARNLMINDWLYCTDRQCNVQIIGLDNYKKVTAFIVEINEIFSVDADKLEPIRITDDIFHRNGFRGDGYLFLTLGEGHHLEYYP